MADDKKNNVISLPNLVGSVVLSNMSGEIDKLKRERQAINEQAARTILYALGCKDNYTYGHCMRVAYYSVCAGKEMGLDEKQMYNLELSALFHDIGKIGTPDHILLKPTRLDKEEFEIMKKHPEISGEILEQFDGFKEIAKYARHHHERYDGRGYPDKLAGEDIPLISRIILVADTFDAMTSSRPYRKGLSYQVAFDELLEFSGTQFDPEIAKAFIKAMEKEHQKNEEDFYIRIVDQSFKKQAA